jgi:hypothetical protein
MTEIMSPVTAAELQQRNNDSINDDKMLDLAKFRRSCGECTDEELVKAVAAIDPSVEVPDQAKAFLWALIKRLLDTERYALAGIVLWGEALFNPGPRAVQQLLRFVRSTQNMIVLGAAAMGKPIP